MKTGKTLQELAYEINRRANNKRDLVAKTEVINMSVADTLERVDDSTENEFERLIKLNVNTEQFAINEIAHDQVASYCDIPSKYYDRCRTEDPALLAHNVNTWISRKKGARMVRTLDGSARAFMSDMYRPLENEDLIEQIIPIILGTNQYDLMSCEVTDKRLYLKVVGKALSRELAKTGNYLGDGQHRIVNVLFPAITISNSEVGCGALSIQRGLFNSGCSNLAIFGEKSMRKTHVGARHDLLPDDLVALLSDDTRKKTDAALWAQVRDVVTAGFDEKHFNALCDQVEGAQSDRIEKDADVVKVISLAGSRLGIREGEQRGVLQALIEGGDLSRCGLHNAITRFAQDESLTYDRATELERIGAQVIELPKTDWNAIALAN